MKGHPYSHCPSLPSRPVLAHADAPLQRAPLGCCSWSFFFLFVPFPSCLLLPHAHPSHARFALTFLRSARKEGRADGRNQAGKQRSKERNPSLSSFFEHSSSVVVVVATAISIVTQFSPLSHVIAATSCVFRRSNCRRAFLSDRSVFVPHSWSFRTASPILWKEEENISRRW